MKKIIVLGLLFSLFIAMVFPQNNNRLAGTIWIRSASPTPEHGAENDYIEFVNQTAFLMSNFSGIEIISGNYHIDSNVIYLTDLVRKQSLYETGRYDKKIVDKTDNWQIEGNKLYNSFGNAYDLGIESIIIRARPLRNAIILSDKPTTPDILQGVISEYIKEAAHDFSVISMETSENTIGAMIFEIVYNGNDLDFAVPINGNNRSHRLAWQVVDMFANQEKLNLNGNRKFVNYITHERNNYILIRIYGRRMGN